MFAWCIEVLHLSEAEAHLRIAVARASRRHPTLLVMLADGRLHVSGIERLAPHLTEENRDALLKRAVHKTKRQIEEVVAELAPRPAAPTRIRRLPALRRTGVGGPEVRPDGPRAADGDSTLDGISRRAAALRLDGGAAGGPGPDGAPGSDAQVRPDGPRDGSMSGQKPTRALEAVARDRFRLQFDLDAEFRDELERLQALTRAAVPDGDLAKVVRLAVKEELKRREAKRFAQTRKPRKRLAQTDTTPKARYIPAAVRRFVAKRDGGRCTYRGQHGRRCTQRHELEFHHTRPFGRGGDHGPESLVLMCRTHNQQVAEEDYGSEKMARHRRRASPVCKPAAVGATASPSQAGGQGRGGAGPPPRRDAATATRPGGTGVWATAPGPR